MNIIPNSKPQLSKEDAEKLLEPFALANYPVRLLGVRGYYKQTMGNPVKNDIGIYDDAIFIISPEAFISVNANTDPSIARAGIATLVPGGPYLYKVGIHHPGKPTAYEALRQYGRVTVTRQGGGKVTDSATAPFYIDIHKGGYGTTSSEGCQTIYPDQWPSFLKEVKLQLAKNNQNIIPYCLVEM